MEKFFVEGAKKILPPVNDSPYKRIIAVGDIHGKFKRFMSLWKKLYVTDEDLIIFLGDYVDRGESVAEVLERVMIHKKKNFIFLRGNHEQMMLEAFRDDRDFLEEILDGKIKSLTNREVMKYQAATLWIINGGQQTLAGINILRRKKFFDLDYLMNFVEGLPLSHTLEIGGRKYFFCHAGVKPGIPLEEQRQEDLLWIREKFFDNYDGDEVIISGHSPLQAYFDFEGEPPRPIKLPDKNILMVDTGSFMPDGKISGVDILSGQYWQSSDATYRIMFVCAWNTCRSAMAEYIMRHLLNEAGLADKIYVDSAGCVTEGGEPLGRRTSLTLTENKIPIAAHESKSFTVKDYNSFDCVVALDEDIFKFMKKLCGGDPENKIRLLKDSDGNSISVADPGFEGEHAKTFSKILRGCSELLKEVSTK